MPRRQKQFDGFDVVEKSISRPTKVVRLNHSVADTIREAAWTRAHDELSSIPLQFAVSHVISTDHPFFVSYIARLTDDEMVSLTIARASGHAHKLSLFSPNDRRYLFEVSVSPTGTVGELWDRSRPTSPPVKVPRWRAWVHDLIETAVASNGRGFTYLPAGPVEPL